MNPVMEQRSPNVRVLLVQRDTPSGVRSAMPWTAGEEVYVCGWGSPLTGLGFDRIEVDGEPRDERERDWVNFVLRCRLYPKGELRTWT